ncbi:MAG TPA: cytochrome c biogenesis protein CcsA, partial [Myxococcota bacterium]|nr:cytochrome c biogenesis protein CcsA [Myxococcota bacterium]
MSPFGNLCLAAALGLSIFAAALSVAGARLGSARLVLAAQRAVYANFALIAAASFALVYMFLVHDFTNEYVWKHSDTTMPTQYLVTAWWGGMDGSMLFWLFWLSAFSAAAVFVNRNRYRQILPYAAATLMTVSAFFCVLLLFETNPFRTFLVRVPTEGEGLNPLLQNPTMVIHPPNLYLGFVGMTVPFAFAMGALISGQLDGGWIKAIRRWTILAWMFLSCGNLLGGWWAYTELGWGGFWAWDPVENAAFMPWLTATAFLHSIMITERRGMLKVWNMVLVVLSFTLTLLGT